MKNEELFKGLLRSFKEFYTVVYNQITDQANQKRERLSSEQAYIIAGMIYERVCNQFPDLKEEDNLQIEHTIAILVLVHSKRGKELLEYAGFSQVVSENIIKNFNTVISG